MRLRICQQQSGFIDGVPLEDFRTGRVYEIDTSIANVFLAEAWAEPVSEGDVGAVVTSHAKGIALLLVVDDERDVRQFTASVLTSSGYEVVEARHGREAIARLSEYVPDLVILDLNMPVMNGWQFRAEQQRLADAQLATIPVLLVTGTEVAGEHAQSLNAVGLIHKPFEPGQLLDAIETALQR